MSDWEDCDTDSKESLSECKESASRVIEQQNQKANKQSIKQVICDDEHSSYYSGSDSEYDSECSSSYSYIEERSDTHESQKDIVYWFKQQASLRIIREHPLVKILVQYKKTRDSGKQQKSPSFYESLSNYNYIDLSNKNPQFVAPMVPYRCHSNTGYIINIKSQQD